VSPRAAAQAAAPRPAAQLAGEAVVAERLRAQLLAGAPARDALTVTRRLLAVQAQDPRGARLAIRVRSKARSAAGVDRALSERSLLITWLNRGTLHLIASEDYGWLHALTTPPLLTGNARRLAQTGVSPALAERGVRVIERALGTDGPLTRPQLRERLDAAGVPTAGQALVHLLMLSSLQGLTVRGPMIGHEHAYVLVADWLGEQAPVARERALAELARRYLAGHAPAGERDLARWAGLPLRDARAGLAAIAPELRERADGLLEPAARRRAAAPPALPPPRLLGAYDPLLLGWCSREEIVGQNKTLVTNNGLFRPFALVRGKAVASWRLAGGKVTLEPFGRLARADRAALDAEAEAVLRYLAEPLTRRASA
jgi:hypothetical protein